jgi:hypothetical protein
MSGTASLSGSGSDVTMPPHVADVLLCLLSILSSQVGLTKFYRPKEKLRTNEATYHSEPIDLHNEFLTQSCNVYVKIALGHL